MAATPFGLLAATMLAPPGRAELTERVRHLSETRTQALDTGAAEIRRIERDPHDGAQARLVAMGTTLDAAGRIIDTNPEAARALIDIRHTDGMLRIGVTDNGPGGADPIAQRLVITERAVAKHTASILSKLNLQPSDDDNRRVLAVLAVLAYLEG